MFFGLLFSLPLADAAGDRRAFSNIHPVFILIDADYELHAITILALPALEVLMSVEAFAHSKQVRTAAAPA
jgi:hypothetical protein